MKYHFPGRIKMTGSDLFHKKDMRQMNLSTKKDLQTWKQTYGLPRKVWREKGMDWSLEFLGANYMYKVIKQQVLLLIAQKCVQHLCDKP